MAEERHLQFADLDWQQRWNKSEAVAGLSQAGADVMATGFFGVIRFRLDDDASVASIISLCRLFATMIENAKRDYDRGQASILPLAGEEPCGAS